MARPIGINSGVGTRMPIHILWKVIFLVLSIGLVVTFQNCSLGTEAQSLHGLAKHNSRSTAAQENAAVLEINPYIAANTFDIQYSTNLDPFRSFVGLKNQADTNLLTNGVISFVPTDDDKSLSITTEKDYIFSSADPRFDQVNAYYYLDAFIEKLKLQNLIPQDSSGFTVNARCKTGDLSKNNAYYEFASKLLCLGYSPQADGTVAWSAKDADVVVHEFGHAVNDILMGDSVLGSSADTYSIIEGFADVWTYLQNRNPYIGHWYGRAIYAAQGYIMSPASFKGLRNLSGAFKYPQSLVGAIHQDGRTVSMPIYRLSQMGVDHDKLRQATAITLASVQAAETFSEILSTLKESLIAVGVPETQVAEALLTYEMYKKDSLDSLSLPIENIKVSDGHKITSYQKNGNCNGMLDVGETVLVFPNFTNAGTILGGLSYKLTTTAPQDSIVILAGGDVGTISKINAASDFFATSRVLQSKDNHFLWSGFGLKALKEGQYDFSIAVKGFNTLDTSVVSKVFTFSLNVGSSANIEGKCPGNGETTVWP